jgi:hypothetical protein
MEGQPLTVESGVQVAHSTTEEIPIARQYALSEMGER